MVVNQISPFTLIWMSKKGSLELPKTKSGKSIVWIWKDWSFTKKVRQGYLALYEKEPERIVKIDASQSFEAVFADVLAVLENRLGILKWS